MTDGKLVTDLKGVSAVMDAKCKAHEMKEKATLERIQRSKERFTECRRKISIMHEKRAEKEEKIERVELKIKQVDRRLQTIEQKIEYTRQSMRVEPSASDEIITIQKKVKEAFMKQSELQAKTIRAMRRKDTLEKHVETVQDKESSIVYVTRLAAEKMVKDLVAPARQGK